MLSSVRDGYKRYDSGDDRMATSWGITFPMKGAPQVLEATVLLLTYAGDDDYTNFRAHATSSNFDELTYEICRSPFAAGEKMISFCGIVVVDSKLAADLSGMYDCYLSTSGSSHFCTACKVRKRMRVFLSPF